MTVENNKNIENKYKIVIFKYFLNGDVNVKSAYKKKIN
jgi:hypothetical protein